MDSILDLVPQLVNGGAVSQISQQIGADEQKTGQGIAVAVPLLLAALNRNASRPEGAQALYGALERDHDGGILDNPLAALLGGSGGGSTLQNGFGILGHVLGGQQSSVAQTVSQRTGLSPAAVGQLLAILAPLVMGALGRARQQNNLDPNGLSAYLNGQQQQAETAAPGILGLANSLLDANQDGSTLDDLAAIAGRLFRR